jgi:hypothetical protein
MNGNNGGPKIAASAALAALQVQGCDFLKVRGSAELIKFLDKNASTTHNNDDDDDDDTGARTWNDQMK